MLDQAVARKSVKSISELLILFLTVVGLLLIIGSFILPVCNAQDLIRGIGLSLFPAGIVAFLLSRFAAMTTEFLLTKVVEDTIEKKLKQHMVNIEGAVKIGLQNIDENMKDLSPLFISSSKLGLENVHLTRSLGLENFSWFLDAEVRKAENEEQSIMWFVSSSIKGFLEVSNASFDGKSILERIAKTKCDLRILMTDPEFADFRAKQEERSKGDIPNEINMNLVNLKNIGIKREAIRFYPGTPTVFAIRTTDRMLLNPYPYQTEAFRCFTIIVHKTLSPPSDIYSQYLRYHFQEPWELSKEVSPDFWNSLSH